ncbi:TetR/AcrR family transcriptional regulator [Pararhodospirillum photometricum]|uniref:Transcriptional regulator, TetR family n=1 Tax=Pararhodospirillum photometricum DSM 122 TaxID=1150469 RepID=H6SLI4_PARPM|nr:TetR/AcrR family transcriptional regulator [Pararhodospirillum photometricum]CCG08849.1 Transcriptional regulator, TetR family [Pararhodospirillum photometricum DSM 122]
MARPRAFDETEVLLQALRVFWAKGFEATTLADLLDATGLSKSSLYAAFGGKRELFLAAFAAYRDERRRRLHAALTQAPSGRAALEAYFAKVVAHAQSGEKIFGCMTCNEAVEFGPHDEAVQHLVHDDFRNMEAAFAEALARGVADGSLAPCPLGEQTRARLLVVHLLGLQTLARAKADPAVLDDAVALLFATVLPSQ